MTNRVSSNPIHEGGCLCGAIRYRATGAPSSVNTCYCTQCRRQTGSALPAFATWPLDRIAILKGEPAGYRASPDALREFCPTCGSTLFWRGSGRNEIDVFLGTLDSPESVPAPIYQLWTRHRLPWVPALPGVPDHPEQREPAGI